jgi:hypothetical protein
MPPQNVDELYDEIFEKDRDFLYEDRIQGAYYIGVQYHMTQQFILLVNTISPRVYFQYKHEDVVNYLEEYSMFPLNGQLQLNIIKLHILPDLSYSAIIKTYWIRLVQRHWQKRMRIWKSTMFLKDRERGVRRMATTQLLRGMLSMYRKQ